MGVVALVLASFVSGAAAEEHRPTVLTVVRDPAITEASGIVADPDSPALFTLQDAGTNAAQIYAIGPGGETALTTTVPGVVNEDWEDLALGVDDAGGDALFIGDIGDAYFVRRDDQLGPRIEFRIIRIPKPVVDMAAEPATVEAGDVRSWQFAYADQGARNAETLLVQPGTNRVFVVNKTERASEEAFLWMGPEELGDDVNTFERVAPVPVTGASGGTFSPSGDLLVIRDAEDAYVWRVEGDDVVAALETDPVVVRLPPQRQGEGVDFLPDGDTLVVNSEGAEQAIYRVPLPEEIRGGGGGEPSDAREAAGAPAADLTGSRGVSTTLLVGVAAWLALVAAAAIVWWRRKEKA